MYEKCEFTQSELIQHSANKCDKAYWYRNVCFFYFSFSSNTVIIIIVFKVIYQPLLTADIRNRKKVIVFFVIFQRFDRTATEDIFVFVI